MSGSVVFFTLRFAHPTAARIDDRAADGVWFTARADHLGDVLTRGGNLFAASPWRAEKGGGLWDLGSHARVNRTPVTCGSSLASGKSSRRRNSV